MKVTCVPTVLASTWGSSGARSALALGVVGTCFVALAGCSSQPSRYASGGNGRHFDPRLGVYASPRLVADGEPVPRGGGGYLTGRPYVIGGRTYYPTDRAEGYSAVGTASWYGDAFHGRRTANGEIFDKNSISAAHPTLPLPSYVRVTNLKNGRSIVVRVNDRGPYHGGRVMDVSQRVAEALAFKGEGMARIRIDYVGRASLSGSDDSKLLATLRVDGAPAELDGSSASPALLANADPPPDPAAPPPLPPDPASAPIRQPVARSPEPDAEPLPVAMVVPRRRSGPAPMPPSRPYDTAPTLPPTRPAGADRATLDRLIDGTAARPRSPETAPGQALRTSGDQRLALARKRTLPPEPIDGSDAVVR